MAGVYIDGRGMRMRGGVVCHIRAISAGVRVPDKVQREFVLNVSGQIGGVTVGCTVCEFLEGRLGLLD